MLFLRKNKQTKQDKQSLVQIKWNDTENSERHNLYGGKIRFTL